MAGINISIDEQALQSIHNKLNQLGRSSKDPSTALAQIGEYLQRSTRERLKTQTDPDGTPWATLSDKTKKGSFPIPWGNIPARQFLGISQTDQTDQTHILNIIETHIAKALNNNA